MIERTKWIDRVFDFNFPEGWIYNILERLRGTGARLREITDTLTNEILIYKPNLKWSIKEHIGHLADLEDLHLQRINDFIERKEILSPADMENIKTMEAFHNKKEIGNLIESFISKRNYLISRFEKLDDEIQNFTSLHPRLKIKVRPVDIAYFTAEHDDHHLAYIREILDNKN